MPTGPIPGVRAQSVRAIHLPARSAAAAILLAVACQSALAQVQVDGSAGAPTMVGGGTYALDRWTVDGGGGQSSGGAYSVSGTIAQPDSDPLQPSTGGAFAITGGFWPGLARGDVSAALFSDGFELP